MIEQLGMNDLFSTHLLWGSTVKIKRINGGVNSCNETDDDDDNDHESDEDDEDCNIRIKIATR